LIVLWYKTNQVTSINEPKARTRLTPVSLIIKDSKDIIASANPHRSNPKGLVEYDLVGDDKIECAISVSFFSSFSLILQRMASIVSLSTTLLKNSWWRKVSQFFSLQSLSNPF